MGDRANIRFKQSGGSVWLYAHWMGTTLHDTALAALAAGGERWRDESYCTRFIVGQCIKDHIDDCTGFGLSTDLGDNEHPILEIDFPAQMVRLRSQDGWRENKWKIDDAAILHEWTFEQLKTELSAMRAAVTNSE
jgi:hypothetical protein